MLNVRTEDPFPKMICIRHLMSKFKNQFKSTLDIEIESSK